MRAATTNHSSDNHRGEVFRLDQRWPELDGVRGAAILSVILFHYISVEGSDGLLPHGLQLMASFAWTGVDLFFVLSGFLIGGILIDNKKSNNYFRTFYARRICRIFPLYFAVLVISIIVYYSKLAEINETVNRWFFADKLPWYPYFLYLQNYWMAFYNSNESRIIDATWSLAIEEQFYLAFPFVVRVIKNSYLPAFCIIGVVLAIGIRMLLFFTTADMRVQFRITCSRLQEWTAYLLEWASRMLCAGHRFGRS